MMEYLKESTTVDSRRVAHSLTLKDFVRGFMFPIEFLSNPTIVEDFKQEHKAQTYIRAHHHAFDCDPIYGEVR